MSGQRRADRHNDRQHQAALHCDWEQVHSAAIEWYRETLRLMGQLMGQPPAADEAMTWDDLSDRERALFRAVEKHEQRKALRR